jgi:predicted transposase YbfD/YdcC
MSLIRENSKLIASNANAISERDTAKKEALNLSSHCERLKALIKHYETDGKAGTITRQAVQALDEQAKSLANAVIELNTLNANTSTQSGQGGRGGGGRQILASNVSAQLTALQKSLQETSQFTANSIRASNESAEALKARCDLLERSASDLQAQLVAALEATSTLKLVPSIVADAALEGQRLAEEECAQLEQELKALYVQTMPRVGGGGGVGVNKNNSTHETFADGTSTSSYRVLHLISNPTSTAVREADAKQRQMLDALKLEAKNLREQLAAELRKVASSSIALRAMQSQLASAEREKNELQKAFSNLRENASALVSATPILSPILSTTLMAQEQQGHINAVAIAADSAVAASVSTPTPVAAAQTVDFEKYKTQLLKSVTEKIHKFKDAVKVLTGWQFGITDTERTSSGGILNRFVLTSLFAEAEHDTLVFVQEISANGAVGDINLASSPYAERIPKDILAVLKLTNSYPAFLAAITSDAVARSTVS